MSVDQQISAVRRFNRFYTLQVGLLRKTFLGTPWTLGETRVLYEIWLNPGILAKEVALRLDLDTAYLSRLIAKFEKTRLIQREQSIGDGRQYQLFLTEAGHQQMEAANAIQREETKQTLLALTEDERENLIDAMAQIERLLSKNRGGPNAG